MRYQTTIDTVGIQIDAVNEMTRNMMLEGILALYKRENLFITIKDYPLNQHSNFYIREYHVYANNITVVSIKTGSFSIKDTLTNVVTTTYYISLEFAGLMRYNQILDQITNSTLFKTCAYLNSNLITFKLTGLDVCIDLYTKFDNVLALCTKKTPKTVYWATFEEQVYPTTTYIEKIKHNKLQQAVQRAYLYDKAYKEGLEYNLTRFEMKLQPKFFNKNRENIISGIMHSLDKYHVMYVPNKKEKQHLMREYDSHSILRQRDIKKLKFDSYRCHPDISVVVGFINRMFSIIEQNIK